MSFLWPTMLILLLSIPVFVLLYFRIQHRRRRAAAEYGGLGLMQQAGGRQIGLRRHVPSVLFLVGLTVLVFGLARPQAAVSVARMEGTVVLAFDVSGSMAADDVKPTRMEAAKTAARDFIQHQPPSVQIGIVAFSDSGFSVQAPTDDQDLILAAIDRLAPQRGTSLANGILVSLKTIAVSLNGGPPEQMAGEPPHLSNLTPAPTLMPTPVPRGTYMPAILVLLTDGENNESPDPLAAAQAAADRGVRIYTVGLGSPTGTTLHVNGFTVHTQLDEAMLQQIAQISGGAYYNAGSEGDLHKVYDRLDTQLVVKPEKMEVTSIFAGASILVLLIAGLFSLLWFGHLP